MRAASVDVSAVCAWVCATDSEREAIVQSAGVPWPATSLRFYDGEALRRIGEAARVRCPATVREAIRAGLATL